MTYLSTAAASMRPGQWLRLAPNGLTTGLFTAGSSNTLGYMDKAAYDPVHRQIRFIGKGHYADQRYHCYDEISNSWVNLPDPWWDDGGSGAPSYLGHGYQHNTIDPFTGDHYYRVAYSGKVWRMRRINGVEQWDDIGPGSYDDTNGSLEWMPNIGTQGGLVFADGKLLRRWDKATRSWSVASTQAGQDRDQHGAFSVTAGRFVFGGGNSSPDTRMFSVGPTGPASPIQSAPFGVGTYRTITTACPTSGEILLIWSATTARRLRLSDWTWQPLAMPSGASAPPFSGDMDGRRIVAATLWGLGVIAFVFGREEEMWLYKHA